MQTDKQTAGVNNLAELEREAERVKPELGDRHIRFALSSRSGFISHLIEDTKQWKHLTSIILAEIVGEKSIKGHAFSCRILSR